MAQPTQERLAAQLEKPQETPGNVGHGGSGIGPQDDPHFQDHEDDHTHHVAMKTYYVVFALLMFLLVITVGAWWIDQHYLPLGKFSTPLAMAIAIAKAVAIVLIFMHVKFSSRLVQVFSVTGIAFTAILFLLTFNDYGTRSWLPMAGVYTSLPDQNSTGDNSQRSGTIIRSSSVGSAPNAQTQASDNTVGSAANAPGNANQTAIDGARDRGAGPTGPVNGGAQPSTQGGTSGATSMSGALANPNSTLNLSGGASNTDSRGGESATIGTQASGATGASGMASRRDPVALSGSTQGEGPIVGGAANNVYGSSVQSEGIQPKRAAPAVKSVPPVKAGARPGTATERPVAQPATNPRTATPR